MTAAAVAAILGSSMLVAGTTLAISCRRARKRARRWFQPYAASR